MQQPADGNDARRTSSTYIGSDVQAKPGHPARLISAGHSRSLHREPGRDQVQISARAPDAAVASPRSELNHPFAHKIELGILAGEVREKGFCCGPNGAACVTRRRLANERSQE